MPTDQTRQRIQITLLALILALPGTLTAGQRARHKLTALDRYVFQPDPNYQYKLVNSIRGEGFTAYVIEMTSQQWRTAAEVDRPFWRHWLTIVRPDQVRTSTGFLLINGGSVGRPAPKSADRVFTELAKNTGSVVADLRQIPNEPLTFAGESKSRTEDAIIAYTWDKFLRTGDETWPLRLPMTKSAVRAMDTITEFCGSTEAKTKVDKFVVAGGSKRGWTAWTTAAVDDRVVAVMPFVIDVLNAERSMEHHFRSYGFWAPALGDYVKERIMDWSGTREYKALMKIEDAYSYRDRLTMPKLIVNSTGDEYFLPDSWQFYFKDLKGENYLRYVPNTKHSLSSPDALMTLQAYYELILGNSPRPRFSWRFAKDGGIVVNCKDKPTEVKLWQATNPKARDFRLDSIGPAYKSSPLTPERDGTYVGKVPDPPEGWTAYFVELTFPTGGRFPLKLTTGVRIRPDRLPFPAPAAKRPGLTASKR